MDTLFSAFHQASFAIDGMKDRFHAVAAGDHTVAFSDSAMALDPGNPTLIDEEIAASVEFFKKIKFKYIEQESKETFLKLMLAEEPLQIDQAENDRLAEENRQSKETLKKAKTELDQLREEVLKIAEEVAVDHDQLAQDIQQAEHYSKEIREIELELSRLRQAVPPADRMTIDEANQILDDQIMEIQTIADEGDAQAKKVEEAKREVAGLMKDVDRLEPERKKDELRIKTAQFSRLTEDGESLLVEKTCRWYSTQLGLYKDILSLRSITSGTGPNGKNELHLTYSLPVTTTAVGAPPNHKGRGGQGPDFVKEQDVTLVLVFHPNKPVLLLDATLLNSDMDISEMVNEAQRAGDVPGLVGDVLMRLRAGL